MQTNLTSTEQPNGKILQYCFLFRRKINGIDFANNDVAIVVHRDGKIASIHLRGAEIKAAVANGMEVPTGKGTIFAQTFTADAAKARFASEFQDASGIKNSLLYVFPDGFDSGIVEPRYVFRFSRKSVDPNDGTVALAKAKHVAYSLRDKADEAKYVLEDQSVVHLSDGSIRPDGITKSP